MKNFQGKIPTIYPCSLELVHTTTEKACLHFLFYPFVLQFFQYSIKLFEGRVSRIKSKLCRFMLDIVPCNHINCQCLEYVISQQ